MITLRFFTQLFTEGRPKQPPHPLVMLIPPQCDLRAEIERVMKINGYTKQERLEDKAGCKRIRLT